MIMMVVEIGANVAFCVICGNSFKKLVHNQKTCSKPCRIINRRANAKRHYRIPKNKAKKLARNHLPANKACQNTYRIKNREKILTKRKEYGRKLDIIYKMYSNVTTGEDITTFRIRMLQELK